MKKVLFLGFLCISSVIMAQTTAIPDSSFENKLIIQGLDTGFADGTVLTSNIDTVTILDVSNGVILDLTGIEDFTALEVLNCSNNWIQTMNLSSNTALTDLNCGWNLLLNLDLTNNVNLRTLDCSADSLVSLDISNNTELEVLITDHNFFISGLDVSNNTALTQLSCFNNGLTNLNVSNNPALVELRCMENSITSLDLTNNPLLRDLNCSYNDLIVLDLRNGNNTILSDLSTINNPNLPIIAVDDANYSNANWTSGNYSIDSWTHYEGSNGGISKISGLVYYDKNRNCIKDIDEKGMTNVVLQIDGNIQKKSITNNAGYYETWVDTSEQYTISINSSPHTELLDSICPNSGHTITSSNDTAINDINFGLTFSDCAISSVDITKNRMRRCFTNNTTITYKNEGTIDLANAEVFVDFPEYVELISASETYEEIDYNKGIYKFSIDTIKAFSQGRINIIDSVICWNEDIRGYTQCIKTWITPRSTCAETKDTTAWDKSSICVLKQVHCINNSEAQFAIINHGSGDMLSAHPYRFYYDNTLAYTGSFQLLSGDTLRINVTADGSTIRLEADQHPLHPGKSRPRATIEGCGSSSPENASLGFWPQASNDDLDYDISEVCLEIQDSYDPNDKKVSPEGITDNHYIPENEPLDYTIRFQNTGNDIAYNIVVVDTLSEKLDLSSIKITGASHDYVYDITYDEKAVISFSFNNINLPDSNTNEPGSHGFISFKITPIDSVSKREEIENFADIYFDFNSAIRTNTVSIIPLDTVIYSNKIIKITEGADAVGIDKDELQNVIIYPNPSNNYITISGTNNEFNQLNIYDITGKLLIKETLISNEQEINVASLETGIYFISIENDSGKNYSFKMIKE